MARVAVVGAGLAGLVVACGLQQHHEVTVLEKSRGYGGRMATRSAGKWQFDHGAQFFTARTSAFQSFLDPLLEEGVVSVWQGQFAEIEGTVPGRDWAWREQPAHYVAVPGMNALGKHLAAGLDVQLETRVLSMSPNTAGWQLVTDPGPMPEVFDWVIVATPAAQAVDLLPPDSLLKALASTRKMSACFALMLGFVDPPEWPWQAARVKDRDISWISSDSSKPGRPAAHSLVVHSTNAWADANFDLPSEKVREHLLDEVGAVIGSDAKRAAHVDLHRWRYANIPRQDWPVAQLDRERRLAVCGDWLVHGRVEGAFASAMSLLESLEGMLPG